MKTGVKKEFITRDDLYLFNEGRHFRLYEKLGSQPLPQNQYHFAVWAPNAERVALIGDFNDWKHDSHPLQPTESSGLWTGIFKDISKGQRYKYAILNRGRWHFKADPFAFASEHPPATASVITDRSYKWGDARWMRSRAKHTPLTSPVSVYEMHLGSWRRKDGNAPFRYEEIADELVAYLQQTQFTHVEFLPLMEHPFGGSWGYQITGYYAASSRYGDAAGLKYLIDRLHQAGFGVILDWVPSHFPGDEHGLAQFDGTHLYEHADPRQGFHPDWKSMIYNFSRREVRSFLISNAMYWVEHFHADGLRVDAVASLLYLDYSRKENEWIPNIHGGRENLEAISFLQELNTAMRQRHPDIMMIAEDSTAWPGVTKAPDQNGLGFTFKWDMGWMHDTLHYFRYEPIHRAHHHDSLTFRSCYAFHENFMLALSHDESTQGKNSLLAQMPGPEWEKFANLRCLYTYMYALPGKKLLFMGNEFAQWQEWNHDMSLDWHLLADDRHKNMQDLVSALNRLYREHPALHRDCDPAGFSWVDGSDRSQSVISFLRHGADGSCILCVMNLTPVPRDDYKVGVPHNRPWKLLLNSDDAAYGGSGYGKGETSLRPEAAPYHGQPCTLTLTLPPLSGVLLECAM